jgi:hypothetical protein
MCSKTSKENIMAALALLFGLFLVVLLGIASLATILAALQGISLALKADKALAILSVVLVFPAVIFGAVYWLKGKDLPGDFMDSLREKHRKDSGENDQPKPDEHQPGEHRPEDHQTNDHEPDGNGPGAGGGDMHDNVDHRLVDSVKPHADEHDRPFVSEVTEGDPIPAKK